MLFWYSNRSVIIACNFLSEKRVLFSESVPLCKQLHQSLPRSYPANQVIQETVLDFKAHISLILCSSDSV